MKKTLLSAAILLFSATASAQETTTLEDLMSLSGDEAHIIQKSDSVSVSGLLNEISTIIGDQIVQNRDVINAKESRIAVATIVDVDTMDMVDRVGRALTEVMMHEMQVRGFRVVDFKVTEFINVRGDGDTIFSRDVADLKEAENINYVLAGTYTKHADGIVLNMRLIDMSDHVIVSSAQANIPKRFLEKLKDDQSDVDVGVVEEKPFELKVKVEKAPAVSPNSVSLK